MKRPKRAVAMTVAVDMAVKQSSKQSGIVFYSYFKNSAFTAVKRDAKFL